MVSPLLLPAMDAVSASGGAGMGQACVERAEVGMQIRQQGQFHRAIMAQKRGVAQQRGDPQAAFPAPALQQAECKDRAVGARVPGWP